MTDEELEAKMQSSGTLIVRANANDQRNEMVANPRCRIGEGILPVFSPKVVLQHISRDHLLRINFER